MNDAQQNYSTTEKELLAVEFALEKFQAYIIGSPVRVFYSSCSFEILVVKGGRTKANSMDSSSSGVPHDNQRQKRESRMCLQTIFPLALHIQRCI